MKYLALLLAAFLAACGGGEPLPEERAATHPPRCEANPKECQ